MSRQRRINPSEEEKALLARIRRGKKMLVSVVVFVFVLLFCLLLKLNLSEPAFAPYIAIFVVYAIFLGIWTAPENRELREWRRKQAESKVPRLDSKKESEVP